MVSSVHTPTAASLTATSPAGPRTTGALTPGMLIGTRYNVIRSLGRGGFGAVYLAADTRFTARRVAVKEMSDARLSPQERGQAIINFKQEANLLSRLQHSNLPAVSDFFEEGGKAYLVMDFIEGQTLDAVQQTAGGQLEETLVMGWALQICEVLDYLHNQSQPIIFRDLKPSNIMVTPANQIKLIDFGIARIFKSNAARDTNSFGSQGYAAPEQYGLEQTDARTDIYALGATLYDLLTGELPAPSFARKVNPRNFVPPRQVNPRISTGVEQVIANAMALEKQDRYQSAAEMAQAILALGFSTRNGTITGPNPAPTTPTPPGSYPPNPSPSRGLSRRGLLIGGGTLAVAAAGYLISPLPKPWASASSLSLSPDKTVTVNFAYSTEKAAWLQNATRIFNEGNHALHGSAKIIQVQLGDLGSVDGQAQILQGQLKPIAWSPASNLEINRLNYQWQQAHKGAALIDYSEQYQPRSLVKSPLVLASWQQRAQALLKHFNVPALDWDILATAFQANDWIQVGGQAGWGPVKFGHTLPFQSNSGLLTITLLAYHYYKTARGLTTVQIGDANYWNYLHTFEGAVNTFGHSSGTYLRDVLATGPAQTDVVATYENLVLTQQAQAQNLQHQALLFFYPSLNILSDHPFVVLQGDWVTNEQKQAALQYRDFLLDVEQQRQALAYGFRPTHSTVSLNDPGVANNPFVSQASLFPNRQPDLLQTQAQPPDGNVVEALIEGWNQHYPNPPQTNG